MNKKTLYITDLDGTLLRSDKELSNFTIASINSLIEKGVNFTVATARTAATSVKILEKLKLILPVVLMNGVAIYDINLKKYIKVEEIPEEIANKIINILDEHKINGFMYAISGEELNTYHEGLNTKALKDFCAERVEKYNKKFEQVESFLSLTNDNKIVYFSLIDEYERLENLYNEIKKLSSIDVVLYRDVYSESLWFLEVHSSNASKYNAVKYLRESLCFDKIIGFGDNLNDLPLFKACDEGYAVSNAIKELKDSATGVIGENNMDGVARFMLEKLGP